MRNTIIVPLLLVFLSTVAHAGDGIALESHIKVRSEDLTRLLTPVLDELATRGFVSGAEVGRKFEKVSRAVISPRGFPEDFKTQIDRGHHAWVAGAFEDAVRILGKMIAAAHDNPGAFAQDPKLRDHLLKAQIALALSQQRMGDPNATRQTFAEILRSWSDATLSRATYGPDAADLFEETRKDTKAIGHGKLSVQVGVAAGAIYINERYENIGNATVDLIPGVYRVFAKVGPQQMSRCHEVVVRPNEETSLVIDVGFDAAVHTSPQWTGLQFDTAADREKYEAHYAAKFAAAISAQGVAVVGVDQHKEQPVVVGSLVNLMNGREHRRANVALDPDPPVERLRALARFVAGDAPTLGIDVIVDASLRGTPSPGAIANRATGPADRTTTSWTGWRYISGAAAVAALGTGAVLLYYDGECSTRVQAGVTCPGYYRFAAPGWISISGGVALTAITAYLVVKRSGSPNRTAYFAPTPGGAIAGYAARF